MIYYNMLQHLYETDLVRHKVTYESRLTLISHNFYSTDAFLNNQRTNGPVNPHLISGPCKSTHSNEKTLTLITHNPSFIHSVYYIYQIPGHRMQ